MTTPNDDTYYDPTGDGMTNDATLGETVDYSSASPMGVNEGDYGGHDDSGRIAEYPDAIEAYPGVYYDRRDRKPRSIQASLKRVPITTQSQQQPQQICSPNPNRTKLRFYTDGGNTAPVYVQRSGGTSDYAASIALTPNSIPFELNTTRSLYAWSTANGYLYVVEESE